MLEKLKNLKRSTKVLFATALVALVTLPQSVFADATTPTSMLDAGVVTIVEDFAADIVPTVLALITILVPAGLTIWAIGFGIKKGLSFIQRRAKQSI